MGLYEEMLIEHDYIEVKETDVMPNDLHGLWLDDLILINRNLPETRKAEVLYEELAHHKLTYGNILDQSKWINRKFENYAVRHGYQAALPLRLIIEAYHYGISNLHELAEYVELSEEYIIKVIEFYKKKYGLSTYYKGYVIKFEPLQVFEFKNLD
ncbi:ImmA/IrrE family metallo-endopeptidase [Staphylococcus hominis]|uniref:ImmA/IrrE family metallo-endopeptidase n=1 Tax=Staphylococcus hominis TaxID=1290 RepID=UPI002879CE0A|nr:ImmA/IrrE family metallo-endopeptidase [Staphylococcus hominis]MDS3887080.1 ImmA/IrrE family metallo-endopeptidase [Staphylococcus hominis]MDS3887146.1 ImmA/IrrE family metallo-endopeptidase [Staphylococcus hominis]